MHSMTRIYKPLGLFTVFSKHYSRCNRRNILQKAAIVIVKFSTIGRLEEYPKNQS